MKTAKFTKVILTHRSNYTRVQSLSHPIRSRIYFPSLSPLLHLLISRNNRYIDALREPSQHVRFHSYNRKVLFLYLSHSSTNNSPTFNATMVSLSSFEYLNSTMLSFALHSIKGEIIAILFQ